MTYAQDPRGNPDRTDDGQPFGGSPQERERMQREAKGLLAHFFSFDRFITPKLILIVFWLGVAGITLTALSGGLFSAGVGGRGGVGLAGLLLAALYWIASVVFWKVVCELVLLGFRMNENLQAIREQGALRR